VRWHATALLLILATVLFPGRPPVYASTDIVQPMTIELLEQVIGSDQFTGAVVAIASWCHPCKEEMPGLIRLYREYQNEGIQIVAIVLDIDDSTAIQAFVDNLNIPFPVFWVGNAAISRYKIFGVPTTMIVKNGEIIKKLLGQMPAKVMEEYIQDLLRNKNTPASVR
jgi:thiol-disulfide isomerase/thioredoxin